MHSSQCAYCVKVVHSAISEGGVIHNQTQIINIEQQNTNLLIRSMMTDKSYRSGSLFRAAIKTGI